MNNDTLFFVDSDSLFYARTALGEANYRDAAVTMSPAFRRMLRELDGTRSMADLAPLFPQLDHEDLQMWIGELMHQQMIHPVPALSRAERERRRAQPTRAPAAAPAVTMPAPPVTQKAEQQVQEIAHEIQPWLAELGRSVSAPAPGDDLSRTVRMAAVEASSTASSIGREGFFMSPDGPRQPLVPGAQRLILVVEDDRLQATMVSRILESDGYQVKIAANAAQANTALLERPVPDLVLLDVELPDTDGFAILKQLRAHPVFQLLRVVMLTARADRADIAKGVLLGADGYLTKPFRPEMIKMAIRQAMPA